MTSIKVLPELIAFFTMVRYTIFFTSTDILAFARIEQACHKGKV